MSSKLARWSLVAVATCTLGAVCAAAEPDPRPLFKEGEIIVKFRGRVGPETMAATAARVAPGASVARTLAAAGRPTVGLVTFDARQGVPAMVARFRSAPDVEYAEPNFIAYTDPIRGHTTTLKRAVPGQDGRPTVDPAKAADPIQAQLIERQALQIVNDPYPYGDNDAWTWIGTGFVWPDARPNPMVAVIDTGVDYTHPDLAGRVVKGRDWVNADTDPMDDAGHGTHVAGIVAALTNNNTGIAGVSRARVLAIKVLNVWGSGSYFDIAGGIIDAANNAGVKILNLSLGGSGASSTLESAVAYAVGKGKLLVVAAGNSNSNAPHYPAYYARAASFPTYAPSIISVGATGLAHYDGGLFTDYSCEASYSNYGDWVTFVAPGTDIYSTTPTKPFFDGYHYGVASGYDYLSGTSMATPMVAGAAARVASSMPAGTTMAQVKTQLEGTGRLDVASGHVLVDTNNDTVGDTSCWPSGAGYTADTVSALHVAGAMGRTGIYGRTFNANGRVPLPGVVHTATAAGVNYGFGGEVAPTAIGTTYWYLVNVPLNKSYTIRASKVGFTSGYQPVASLTVPDCTGHSAPSCVGYWGVPGVSIPPLVPGRWQIVTDWEGWTSSYEFDQYTFTPATAPIQCSVGYYNGAIGDCGLGQLQTHPYMRFSLDSWEAGGGTEFTSVKTFYPTGTAKYRLLITDYTSSVYTRAAARKTTTRFWLGGVPRAVIVAADGDGATNNCTNVGGAVACPLWYVADFTASAVTPVNIYGTYATSGAGVLPYSRREDTGRTRALPLRKQ